MRSATYHQFGKPSEVLSITDIPMPEPGPKEVRVKTILASIHNHDLITIRGQYGDKPDLPTTPGSEALGIIDAVGEEVEGFEIGQRVATASVTGTWAQYFTAPAKMVFAVPDELEDEIATQLIAMPLSALMLLEFMQLQPGQWVILNAANGAVGKSFAMIAAARGIHTIGLVRRPEAAQELTDLGIEHSINVSQSSWKDKVRELVGDAQISAAVDSLGGEASNDLLDLLGTNGTLVSFGVMASEPMIINPSNLIFKQAVVKGFWGSKTSREMDLENKQRLINQLIKHATNNQLTLPVEAIFDLEDINEAVSGKVQKGKKGKVLLKP
ncbi:zinc-binding dehydrogenase [Psychrobacter sanguinis]|uniref:zinc-binding dehydrogenase n=1 Tax=Psychrobacter sanguinis TaxID=861445 RepID=UPI00020C7E37|nr:zinc-binding dehydrogenase [Psychrobacter sanguinis]EGK13124.1 zinc-containing alcohol dehydrogenase [Psychrobacter sp. 1501(2011)]MCD9150239.1 zinc-binding dehydrogenase [Psychrobacter sanguinis]